MFEDEVKEIFFKKERVEPVIFLNRSISLKRNYKKLVDFIQIFLEIQRFIDAKLELNDLSEQILRISVMDLIQNCNIPLVNIMSILYNGSDLINEFNNILQKNHSAKDLQLCIHDLPNLKVFQRHSIPLSIDLKRMICLHGAVRRIKMPAVINDYLNAICKKCKSTQRQFFDRHQNNRLVIITQCYKCKSMQFEMNNDQAIKCDYQEITLQEQNQMNGRLIKSVCVRLEGRLINCCKAGDVVAITGVVETRFVKSINCELYIRASDVVVKRHSEQNRLINLKTQINVWQSQLQGSDFEKWFYMRNRIVNSICPHLHGMYWVKLSIALLLVSGQNTSTIRRGNIHILLVGDPGVGKSQLMTFVHRLVGDQAVMTTGLGSSTAGLTASAVKEGNEWTLEPGAFVLAHNGVCCIDEFNTIMNCHQASVHEAMEQQTVSIAKAGIICNLKTQCSLLASCNPDQDGCVNMANSLLSRFDLIIALKDNADVENDRLLAEKTLNNHSTINSAFIQSSKECSISMNELRKYIKTVKCIQTDIDDGARKLLEGYYSYKRKSSNREECRTTIRLFESLIRLTQCHGKLIGKEVATKFDALYAILLVEMGNPDGLFDIDPLSPGSKDEMQLYEDTMKCLTTLLDKNNHNELRNQQQWSFDMGTIEDINGF